MVVVSKFNSFEDLKASEKIATDSKLSLQRHNGLEELIREISSAKVGKKGDLTKVKSYE